MVDTIIKIGEMLQFRDYNPKSPLNAAAARWTLENRSYLPVGNIDLYSPEPEVAIGVVANATTPSEDGDLEIVFAKPAEAGKAETDDGDLDIKFK